MVQEALDPSSAVAVILAEPIRPFAVTLPSPSTDAIFSLEDFHVIFCPAGMGWAFKVKDSPH